jgi:DNA-directed RNA polymerase specialized sigma24 family protein
VYPAVPVPELDPERFYREHFPPLVELALTNNLPREQAEELAHEILLASLLQMPRIGNLETWLRGSLTCAIAHRAES